MKAIKFALGFIVVIIAIILIVVILQETGAVSFTQLETIREIGILTWFKNLWLDNVTVFWNENIVPWWK